MHKIVFSEQNISLIFAVEFLPDLVKIQVRETDRGVFFSSRKDIPIQVWHKVEVMCRDFNEHQITQVPMTENQLGEMQMMEEVTDHVGMIYHKTPDSRYVAQQKDLWKTQLLSKRIRGSLSQALQSANHQDNHRRWRQD